MRIIVCVAFFFLVHTSVWAQTAFDQKQKKDTLINTEELNAQKRKFNMPANTRKAANFSIPNLQELKSKASSTLDKHLFKMVGHNIKGDVNFIRVIPPSKGEGQYKTSYNPLGDAQKVMQEVVPVLGLGDKDSFNQIFFKTKSDGGYKVKWEQQHEGVPVYGTEVITHSTISGQVVSINGKWRQVAEIKKEIYFLKEQALLLAQNWLEQKGVLERIPSWLSDQYKIPEPEVRLVIYAHENIEWYAYEVELRANLLQEWTLIVAAKDGVVLEAFDHTCDVDGPVVTNSTDLNGVSREITTYLEGATYVMEDVGKSMFNSTDSIGIIYTLDAKGSRGTTLEDITSVDNTWTPTATSAHYNASVAYDYYEQWHNRSSIDGQGGDIYSVINIRDEAGNEVDNAYWSNPFMVYGNGKDIFEPLAKSLDVAGHEMTHGVVEAEANLAYQGESGAINESFADVFGCLIDSANWTMGEEIMKSPTYPTGALRDLEDPHNGGMQLGDLGWQPNHVNEQYFGSQDNGGVHINSGIPNHAFYLIATSFGRKKAGAIYYKALTDYLTRFSQFVDLRIAVVQSTIDFYGENSDEQVVVENAFDAVGILEGAPSDLNTTLPVNSGEEQILFVDQDDDTPATMYQSDFNVLNPLTTTAVGNRPAVTDDGTLMAFIGEDNKVYLIDISDPTNPIQTEYFSEPIYSSVALSKDGSRIALTTVDQDTAIYVHHFGREETIKFELYNPTYSEGIVSGGVLYADALEWDYTGENIIYDAFNRVVNDNDEDIEFWDVGIIQVWDNTLDDFGTGEIEKIFTGLEKGESIGNPVLAKNSPYIMALDYSYESEGSTSFSILGYNIQTNELGFIFDNNYIAWPSYARLDDYLFFSYVQAVRGEELVFGTAAVPLSASKITAAGSAFVVLNEAKYGMIYSLGDRDIVLGANDVTDVSTLKVFPNPVSTILYIKGIQTKAQVSLVDMSGQVINVYAVEGNLASVDVGDIASGVYVLSVVTKDRQQTFKLLVE